MSKAQMFTVDFILGLVGFIFLLLLAIKIIIDILPAGAYTELYRNNVYISDQLVLDGYPNNWSVTTVLLPGITDDYRLNLTKLTQFDALDYNHTKTLYHVTNEYIFFFKNNTQIINLTNCLHGYPLAYDALTCEPDLSSITYKHLVTTQRLVAYNASLLQLIVYSWE